jgi:Spy/CpxP family protein refolding chaperone
MKSKILSALSAGVLTTGLVYAQSAPTTAQKPRATAKNTSVEHKGEDWQARFVQRLTARLNLTADQQSRVKSILRDARVENQDLHQKYIEERMALNAAVKSNATSQIERIVRENADLNTQMTIAHVKTMAKVYSVLTPEQKAKFDRAFEGPMPEFGS